MSRIVKLGTLVAVAASLTLGSQVAEARMVKHAFGSMLFHVSVPKKWKKVEQTTKRIMFKFGKSGSMRISRKHGKKDIGQIAEGIKKAWVAKKWIILHDRRGKLKGTNHTAMMLRAHNPAAKVKIALYVVNVRDRIYLVMFANHERKFKPKKYNKVMLTFDAI